MRVGRTSSAAGLFYGRVSAGDGAESGLISALAQSRFSMPGAVTEESPAWRDGGCLRASLCAQPLPWPSPASGGGALSPRKGRQLVTMAALSRPVGSDLRLAAGLSTQERGQAFVGRQPKGERVDLPAKKPPEEANKPPEPCASPLRPPFRG